METIMMGYLWASGSVLALCTVRLGGGLVEPVLARRRARVNR